MTVHENTKATLVKHLRLVRITCGCKTISIYLAIYQINIPQKRDNQDKAHIHTHYYRPVSLTSIVCKIREMVIKKQWTEYLER